MRLCGCAGRRPGRRSDERCRPERASGVGSQTWLKPLRGVARARGSGYLGRDAQMSWAGICMSWARGSSRLNPSSSCCAEPSTSRSLYRLHNELAAASVPSIVHDSMGEVLAPARIAADPRATLRADSRDKTS